MFELAGCIDRIAAPNQSEKLHGFTVHDVHVCSSSHWGVSRTLDSSDIFQSAFKRGLFAFGLNINLMKQIQASNTRSFEED